MASGQPAASSCSPLALERGLSVGRRLLLLLSYVTLPRGAPAALFFGAGFVELRWPRVEAGAWKRVLGGWD